VNPETDTTHKDENGIETKHIKKSSLLLKISLASVYMIFVITGLVFSIIQSPETYSNCEAVYKSGGTDGLYKINFTGIEKFVVCKNGATLIQQRSPGGGKQAYFFDRSPKELREGFGYTGQEFWIGLDTISRLNSNGNTVLKIEATVQNGEEIWVEFDIKIGKINDKINEAKLGVINRQYPILSIHQTGSSNNHLYSLGRFESIHTQPTLDRTVYHDFDAGFVHLENDYDRSCPISQHSSWWYPLRYWEVTNDGGIIKGAPIVQCIFRKHINTNLNGVYDKQENQNSIRISACNITDAVEPSIPYDFQCETVPLEKVQMFLRNKE
jgi:hypothetical protein